MGVTPKKTQAFGIVQLGKGSKKSGNFPTKGGILIFYIFSHFKELISKHALNHTKMQRNSSLFPHF